MYRIEDQQILKDNRTMPLYLQIKDSIRKKILSKEWKSGSKIPGETELCEIYQVSRITIRRALEDLQTEGYLTKLQGKGTYVNKRSIEQRLSKFYSFSEELRKKGMQENAVLNQFVQIKANEELAESLRCQVGESIFHIDRVRYTEGKPYVVESSFIPCRFVPELTGEMIREKGLYRSLGKFGVYPDSAVERFSAINLQRETALQLGVKENEAAISLRRTTYSAGEIIEYCTSVVRGDFFSYTVELN